VMTSLKGIWDGLGTMGQILVGGGLAVGLFGLMNSIMGEGGMGSILATLLGGGALALGLNKGNMLPQGVSDVINPFLKSIGLSDLAGGAAPAAPGAAPATTGPGGEPVAATAPPAANSAMKQLGINSIQDPGAVEKLMSAAPDVRTNVLQEALASGQVSGEDLATAASHWEGNRGRVMAALREKLNNPNLPEATGQSLIDAYMSLPEQQRAGYHARWFG
jgi:hypothetical protein